MGGNQIDTSALSTEVIGAVANAPLDVLLEQSTRLGRLVNEGAIPKWVAADILQAAVWGAHLDDEYSIGAIQGVIALGFRRAEVMA